MSSAPSQAGVSEDPTFKLTYFNVKAMAEPIRYLLAYGGQEYEDVRVSDEEWTALKPSKYLYQISHIKSCIKCVFFYNIEVNQTAFSHQIWFVLLFYFYQETSNSNLL